MKYDITINCAGANICIKNVEASNQQDAEEIALKKAKQSIKIVGSTVSVEKKKPDVDGEKMFNEIFGKLKL
jgi:hypothetical protein